MATSLLYLFFFVAALPPRFIQGDRTRDSSVEGSHLPPLGQADQEVAPLPNQAAQPLALSANHQCQRTGQVRLIVALRPLAGVKPNDPDALRLQ